MPQDAALLETLWRCLLLVGACWVAYLGILKGQWVSDDWDGVAHLDGKFKRLHQAPPPPVGALATAPGAQPQGGSLWNDVLTWVRWHIGKAPNPAYNKLKDPAKPELGRDNRQFLPNALRHHRFSLILFSGIVILLYGALSAIVGEQVAFLTVLLWIVHPVGVQAVGWISGIGYVLATFFMLAGLNYALLVSSGAAPTALGTPYAGLVLLGYGVLQFLAFRSQFTSIMVAVILAYLGLWPFACVAALIAAFGFGHTVLTVVTKRAATFKAQQMGASTTLHPKKLVVVFKTLWYYVCLAFFPKRLGLYHTYGYHYPLPWIEWEDRTFWYGVGSAMALGAVAWLLPPPAAFAVLWFLCFIVFVLNWITVHQFVAERYLWLPVIGMCLLVAVWAPPWLYWLLVGVALMRTWAHLPTYFNELMFYQSNVWNHPQSEVAFGNLGVTYLRMGLPGSAVDHWTLGGNVNQDYDVNWYNLYSIYRSQHMYAQAHTYLLKALSCSTCHFPVEWRQEKDTLECEITWQQALTQIPTPQKDAWQKANLDRLTTQPEYATWPKHIQDFWTGKAKGLEEYLKTHPLKVESTPVVTATT